jgi:methylmalonyl-CoA mutase C-terminal domain/subunit
MNTDRNIRILIAKVGCDIHERGALTLLHTFRDAGMEAIYTGRYQTAKAVVAAAIDEDVDVIALSDHTGSMPIIAESVLDELKRRSAGDIRVMTGGLISPDDARVLREMGAWGNFGPGTPLDRIVNSVRELVRGEGRLTPESE